MNIHLFASRFEKLIADNSPVLLTAIGATGTVATAFLTGKAVYRYTQEVDPSDGHLSTREKLEICWVYFIPPVVAGTLTVTAIIAANQVSTRRAAGLASAYAVSERAYAEYKERVVERMGAKPEQKIRDEIAQSRVTNQPPSSEIVVLGTDVLCHEAFTGRYFTSDMETLKKAQNDLNYEVISQGYASLTDFYDRLGLERTQESDELGWTPEHKLEIQFSTVLSRNGQPCISITYNTLPIRDFWKVG